MKRHLILILVLLASSLACMTVQRALVPVTPTLIPLPVTPGEPVVCQDESCLDACLSRLYLVLDSQPLEDVGGNYADKDAQFNLVHYTVEGDAIAAPITLYVPAEYKEYQTDSVSHQRGWEFFTSIVPAENRKWITQYVIFTDGTYNTLAWVDRVEFGDNSRWKLGVDVLDASDPILLTTTIVHELGHLLTLNSDQIISEEGEGYSVYQNESACPQYMSDEGCSTTESYINRFYQAFWLDLHDEWMETVYKQNAASPEEFRAFVQTFHDNHPAEFVSQYAATNIKEDMAESFEVFVLNPKPTGDTIADRKVLFFYDFPELIALRQQMIQNLCSYVLE